MDKRRFYKLRFCFTDRKLEITLLVCFPPAYTVIWYRSVLPVLLGATQYTTKTHVSIYWESTSYMPQYTITAHFIRWLITLILLVENLFDFLSTLRFLSVSVIIRMIIDGGGQYTCVCLYVCFLFSLHYNRTKMWLYMSCTARLRPEEKLR